MEMLSFLRMVLPPQGKYASYCFRVVDGTNKCRTTFSDTLEELAQTSATTDALAPGVSFVLSSLRGEAYSEKYDKNMTLRTEKDAIFIKSFAMDIDCGEDKKKDYPDWKLALAALVSFVKTTGLPVPLVVRSGSGLHVYWPLTNPLPISYWEPLAGALRQLAENHGLNIDGGCTINPVVGLRPPETRCPKNGRKIEVIYPIKEPYPIGAIEPILAPLIQELEQKQQAKLDLPKKKFAPADANKVGNQCPQILWGSTHQPDVLEPFWYLMMGIAGHCHAPDDVAIAWSNQHPDYEKDKTIKKMRQWLDNADGPPTCSKFQLERPEGCKKCKFAKYVNTPVALGRSTEKASMPIEANEFPQPYKYTEDGIKLMRDGVEVDLFPHKIYPASYGLDEQLGVEVVRFMWNAPHEGWKPLVLRQSFLVEGSKEFENHLADNGITFMRSKQAKEIRDMLRTLTDDVKAQRKGINFYSTMGWKESQTEFVLGDTTFRKGDDGKAIGEKVALSSSATEQIKDTYVENGSIRDWANLTEVLEQNALYHFMFALGVGFSAPLYDFAGLKGLTISFYGPTGSGKSLAQLWAQSIFGAPTKLHFAADSTIAALFHRIAVYNNTLVTIDEVTKMPNKEVGGFCYSVSQGTDKARMNPTISVPQPKTWATPVLVSTNQSFASKLAAGGFETDAQHARLLEFSLAPAPCFINNPQFGRDIYDELQEVCGTAGREYLKHLVELGPDGIRVIIKNAMANFKGKYGVDFSGEERYWQQAIVFADLGLSIANDLGLIKFNYEQATRWVIAQLGSVRGSAIEMKRTPIDMINEYMTEHLENTIAVYFKGDDEAKIDQHRIPRKGVRVRIELSSRSNTEPFTSGKMYFEFSHFRTWLARNGSDMRTIREYMGDSILMGTNGKNMRIKLGRYTGIETDQVPVVAFNLSHGLLSGILDKEINESSGDVVPIHGNRRPTPPMSVYEGDADDWRNETE